MASSRIDHVNLRIPEDRVDAAVEFYVEVLGLEPMKLDAYEHGERTSFFVRIGETAVINLRPVDTFEPPTGESFDHFCVVLDEPMTAIEERLDDHGVEVLREGNPLGAAGRAPAVYVRDPFGYTIELRGHDR